MNKTHSLLIVKRKVPSTGITKVHGLLDNRTLMLMDLEYSSPRDMLNKLNEENNLNISLEECFVIVITVKTRSQSDQILADNIFSNY